MKYEITKTGFKEIKISASNLLKYYVNNVEDEPRNSIEAKDVLDVEKLLENKYIYFTRSNTVYAQLHKLNNEINSYYQADEPLHRILDELKADYNSEYCFIISAIQETIYYSGWSVSYFAVPKEYVNKYHRKILIDDFLLENT